MKSYKNHVKSYEKQIKSYEKHTKSRLLNDYFGPTAASGGPYFSNERQGATVAPFLGNSAAYFFDFFWFFSASVGYFVL